MSTKSADAQGGEAGERLKTETAAFASDGAVSLPSSNLSISETGTLSLVVDGKAQDVEVSAAFTNRTKTRARFAGVAGALVGSVGGDEKMKVSDGLYASDPLSRGMTMAAIALHPVPYDSTLPEMSPAERTSILLGGILTPAPGVGLGFSVGVARGLGVVIGGALMFVPTSRDDLKPNQPAPEVKNQLRYGWTSGAFLGIACVFTGS